MSRDAQIRRIAARRAERVRREAGRAWHNQVIEYRTAGARPPNDDEIANAHYYAEKVERMLIHSGGNVKELGRLLYDLAQAEGMQCWARYVNAERTIHGLLEGKATLGWVMDILDAGEEFLAGGTTSGERRTDEAVHALADESL